MRIAILTETFSKRMGYATTALPKHLARLGAEVHVFTSGLPPYHQIAGFESTYGQFSGAENFVAGAQEQYDGYTLHVLPFHRPLGYVRLRGLRQELRLLRPDVVQTFTVQGWDPIDAAIAQLRCGFALFTGNHTTASVFLPAQPGANVPVAGRIKNALVRALPGALVSSRTELCYGATVDCADVAVRFFGVPSRKIAVAPLGVDTDVFTSATSTLAETARQQHRARYGVGEGDIVCIYTGRLTEDKNPLLLARAVAALRNEALPFRSHFVGDGAQAEAIAAMPGAMVHPFVHFTELADWYRASDIGVWPTQESTSMLDAAACGLPIVVNDSIRAVERIQGNGVTYRLDDEADLIRVLRELMPSDRRTDLGVVGARRIRDEFSWSSLAARRLEDYERVITRNRRRGAGSAILSGPESARVANG